MLDENSPRPRTWAYIVHRLRAMVRHQGLIYGPCAVGFATALCAVPALDAATDLGLLVSNLVGQSSGAMVILGARVWMRSIHARIGLWLDAHPQGQDSIAMGYCMPERPVYADPFVILGETHPEREYEPSGAYKLVHTIGPKWSATPEWCVLPALSLVTGTMVFGSIGTGKTAYILRPGFFRIFHHATRPGGLVMDSKASLSEPLLAEMKAAGREADIRAIGPHRPVRWNPLHQPDATPETVAESIMVVAENVRRARLTGDSQWIRDGAHSMAAGAIGVLRLRYANYVTANSIMSLLDALLRACSGSENSADDAAKFLEAIAGSDPSLKAAPEWQAYTKMLVSRMGEDEKFRAIYRSEIVSVLQPLLSPRVVNLYNPPTPDDIDFPDWRECINAGLVAVLECNASAEPNLSVILGMFLKLGYQNSLLARISPENSERYNQQRHMCLIIDEYQDYVSPGDSDYLAKCRQSRSITAFFTQGWPSLCERVDEKIARVILQSCKNILVLQQVLPEEVSRLVFGEAERARRDISTVEHTDGARLSAAGRFEGLTSVAQSLTDRTIREVAVPPEILKSLPTGQGIFVGHDGYEPMPVQRVYAIPHYRAGWRAVEVGLTAQAENAPINTQGEKSRDVPYATNN